MKLGRTASRIDRLTMGVRKVPKKCTVLYKTVQWKQQ